MITTSTTKHAQARAAQAVDQHALEAEPRAVQERQPVRRVGGWEASGALKGGIDLQVAW